MGNTCSGGYHSAWKRSDCEVEIPIERVVEEWEQYALYSPQILPVEMWDHILGLFKENGKDLLKCREVCKVWKDVANGMLVKQPLWSPLFPCIPTVPLIFVGGFGETVVRRIRGTKLNSTRALLQFLDDMRDHQENPFPNRTVLLFSNPDLCIPSKRPRHRFYRSMPALLSKFGVHIWSLEYEIREDTSESITLLRHFFELTCLKSLTIYSRDWNKKRVRKRLLKETKIITARQERGEKFLGELTELQILGCNGILPLNSFARIGEQIKSLYFCFLDDASTITASGIASIMGTGDGFRATEIDQKTSLTLDYALPKITPNVINLKVYEVTEDHLNKIFPSRGMRLSCIRQLSIKLQRPFVRPLNRLMKAIDDHCSTSLEILHLEIGRWNTFDNNDNGENERDHVLSINSNITYTKLVDFTLSYALFLHEPEFLFKIAEKCTAIKGINFVSVSIHGGSFPDIESFSKPLWGRLPPSLQKIMVQYWTCPDPVPVLASPNTNISSTSSSSSTTPAAAAANTHGCNKNKSNKKPPMLNPTSRTQVCYKESIGMNNNKGKLESTKAWTSSKGKQ